MNIFLGGIFFRVNKFQGWICLSGHRSSHSLNIWLSPNILGLVFFVFIIIATFALIMIHLGSWVALVNCSTCTEEKDTPFHIFPSSKIKTLHWCKLFFAFQRWIALYSLPAYHISLFFGNVSSFCYLLKYLVSLHCTELYVKRKPQIPQMYVILSVKLF